MKEGILSLYQETIGCSVDKLAKVVLQVAQSVSVNPTVAYRIKNQNTLVKKMDLKQVQSVFEIDDVYGFRILLSSVHEAYAVLHEIIKAFEGYVDHDYIKFPKTRQDKPNLKGKSLRMLQFIAHLNNVSFEVQITTHEFNKANEGLHGRYHSEKYT